MILKFLRAVAGQYRDQGKYDQAIATLQSIPNKTTDVMAELAYTYQLAGKAAGSCHPLFRLAKAAKGNIGLESECRASLDQRWAARLRHVPFSMPLGKSTATTIVCTRSWAEIAESDDRLSDADQEYKLALSKLAARVPEGPLYPIELRLNLYESRRSPG